MATKFSQFDAAGVLTGTEEVVGLQGGDNTRFPHPLNELANTASGKGAELVAFKNSEISSAVATTLALRGSRNFWSVFDVMTAAEIADVRANTALVDVTAKIQDIIDKAEAAGGRSIYFPEGTYKVSATITIDSNGVRLIGAGRWNTRFLRSTDYGDTIFFSGNAGTGVVLSDVEISGFKFQSTALTTSGAHIRFDGVARAKVADIYMLRGFIGFKSAALTAAEFSNIYLVFDNIFGGSATGRRYMEFVISAGAYSHPHCGDVFVSDFNLRGNVSGTVTAFGIRITSADGIWFSNGHVGNTTSANLDLEHIDAQNLSLVFFDNVMFDEGTASNVLIQGATGASKAQSVLFSNCNMKGGGTGTIGVNVAAAADFFGVKFSNCIIWQHTSHGVALSSTATDQIEFSNCTVRGNSFGSAGTANGYQIAAGVSGVQIRGGYAGGDDTTIGGVGEQGFGIRIASGASNNIIVEGVDLRLNTTGAIQNFASGDDVIFKNCITGESNVVASAGTVTLPDALDVVFISGTTAINNVVASWRNRRVTLIFQSTPTVNDGGNLRLAGAFVATADDTLSLVCDGTNWYEVSRSAN